jgi:serine/threonine protein phosphatase PrpC
MTGALSFASAGLSHVGRVRTVNEDAWLARPELGLWAVADGMGGHARGDLASRTIVEALDRLPHPGDARAHLRAVEVALAEAHAQLQSLAGAAGDICGSTVATLLAFDRHYAVVWAGDSRIYRRRGGRLEQLTRDHSLVQELVDDGRLSPEAAGLHPLRSRITRALGMAGPLLPECRQGELAAGDLFLLCTDGLLAHLDEPAIDALLAGQAPEAAATALVDATLAAGAVDNVTLVLVTADAAPVPDRTWPGQG